MWRIVGVLGLILSACSEVPMEQRCDNGLLYERYDSSGPYVAVRAYGEQVRRIN